MGDSRPVPESVYAYWVDHQDASAAEVARATGLPERSVSRYCKHLREGSAVSVHAVPTVTSKHMQTLREEEESFDPIAFFERAPQMVAQAQQRDPIVTHDDFTIETDAPIGIMFVSCMHLGGRYTAYQEFREIYMRALGVKNLYWASLGDDIEGFMSYFPDVRSVEEQLLNPTNQLLCLEALLRPMADTGRLLFGCGSQHGGKWENKRTGRSSIKELYTGFKVPYFDGAGYVRLNIGEETYFVALAHEFPGQSVWNPNHAHHRAARFRFPSADIVVAGDKHTEAVQFFPAYIDEFLMGNRKSPMLLLLQAGTAKNGPDPYTITNFSRGHLGWPIVVLHPKRHEIEFTLSLDRAAEMLGV